MNHLLMFTFLVITYAVNIEIINVGQIEDQNASSNNE